MSTTRLIATALLTMSLALGTSACGGSSDKSPGPTTSGGKVIAGDDMIVKPLEAIGATKVQIGPDEVRVHFDGSAQEATAWTYCTAIQAVIGQKAAIVVYSDGELDCADRYAG